VTAVW